jgi:basic membrane lipoprotein Med (substrate-binding protein (PBP1-ABC) superfamily)
MGLSTKGVSMSKVGDLSTFMEFGIGSGKITSKDKAKIIENWRRMRAAIPPEIWKAVEELEDDIVSGRIVVPTANTLKEMEAVRADYPLKR